MAAKRIHVAIVGAGVISETHLRAYAALGDSVEVVALVESDPARRQVVERRYPSIPAIPDHLQVLEVLAVDLVDVCTPPANHEEIVVAALQAGKLVVCEKPLAPTLEGIDRILPVAHANPGRLATVFQYRMMPEIAEMLRLRDEGVLGELIFGLFADYDRIEGGPIGAKSWWGAWNTAGGGVGMTQFIHRLDLMCLLYGRPVEVTAMVGTLAASIESEDTLSATVRFEGGAIVTGSATMTAWRQGFRIDVLGTMGSVHHPWALHLADGADRAGATSPAASRALRAKARTNPAGRVLRRARRAVRLGGEVPTNHARFLRELVDAAAHARPLPVEPEEARRAVELCTAIYASALSGAPVDLPLSPDSPFYRGISTSDYLEATRERPSPRRAERTSLR